MQKAHGTSTPFIGMPEVCRMEHTPQQVRIAQFLAKNDVGCNDWFQVFDPYKKDFYVNDYACPNDSNI